MGVILTHIVELKRIVQNADEKAAAQTRRKTIGHTLRQHKKAGSICRPPFNLWDSLVPVMRPALDDFDHIAIDTVYNAVGIVYASAPIV